MATDVARAPSSETRASALEAAYTKITWRLIPFLAILWIIAWIDRVNIGFAKLQMLDDLKFSEAAYGFGAGVFFLGYFLFEAPSNLLLTRIGARKTIARITIGWGATSILMMLVKTTAVFYGLRFLLGVFEAGFYPGIILYLTYWYPTARRARSFGLFMSASAFAGVIGGPLAGAILTNLNGANGWAGWQWLFLIEGAPSIIAGVVTLFYLTDRPEEANWLSSEERRLIVDDLEQDKRDMGEREHNILASLRDPKLWLLILIFFCIVAANSALTFWGPSAAKDMGFNDSTTVGWIMAAIYLFGGAGMILNGAHSDRSGEARYHCGVAALIGAVAMAVLGFVINTGAVLPLIALAVAIVGTMSAIPVFWQMPNRILSGAAAAAGVAVINSIANLAGFGSPWLIGELRSSTGGLSSGLLAIAAVEAATFLLILRFNDGKPARAGSES
jgi:sugar phosphate permease